MLGPFTAEFPGQGLEQLALCPDCLLSLIPWEPDPGAQTKLLGDSLPLIGSCSLVLGAKEATWRRAGWVMSS